MNKILLLLIFITCNAQSMNHYIEKNAVIDCAKEQMIFSGSMAFSLCSKNGECLEIKETPYICDNAKIIDEEKTGRKIIVIDAIKKAAYDAAEKSKQDKDISRATKIKELKESAVLKMWNDMTTVEKKIISNLEVTDLELGI